MSSFGQPAEQLGETPEGVPIYDPGPSQRQEEELSRRVAMNAIDDPHMTSAMLQYRWEQDVASQAGYDEVAAEARLMQVGMIALQTHQARELGVPADQWQGLYLADPTVFDNAIGAIELQKAVESEAFYKTPQVEEQIQYLENEWHAKIDQLKENQSTANFILSKINEKEVPDPAERERLRQEAWQATNVPVTDEWYHDITNRIGSLQRDLRERGITTSLYQHPRTREIVKGLTMLVGTGGPDAFLLKDDPESAVTAAQNFFVQAVDKGLDATFGNLARMGAFSFEMGYRAMAFWTDQEDWHLAKSEFATTIDPETGKSLLASVRIGLPELAEFVQRPFVEESSRQQMRKDLRAAIDNEPGFGSGTWKGIAGGIGAATGSIFGFNKVILGPAMAAAGAAPNAAAQLTKFAKAMPVLGKGAARIRAGDKYAKAFNTAVSTTAGAASMALTMGASTGDPQYFGDAAKAGATMFPAVMMLGALGNSAERILLGSKPRGVLWSRGAKLIRDTMVDGLGMGAVGAVTGVTLDPFFDPGTEEGSLLFDFLKSPGAETWAPLQNHMLAWILGSGFYGQARRGRAIQMEQAQVLQEARMREPRRRELEQRKVEEREHQRKLGLIEKGVERATPAERLEVELMLESRPATPEFEQEVEGLRRRRMITEEFAEAARHASEILKMEGLRAKEMEERGHPFVPVGGTLVSGKMEAGPEGARVVRTDSIIERMIVGRQAAAARVGEGERGQRELAVNLAFLPDGKVMATARPGDVRKVSGERLKQAAEDLDRRLIEAGHDPEQMRKEGRMVGGHTHPSAESFSGRDFGSFLSRDSWREMVTGSDGVYGVTRLREDAGPVSDKAISILHKQATNGLFEAIQKGESGLPKDLERQILAETPDANAFVGRLDAMHRAARGEGPPPRSPLDRVYAALNRHAYAEGMKGAAARQGWDVQFYPARLAGKMEQHYKQHLEFPKGEGWDATPLDLIAHEMVMSRDPGELPPEAPGEAVGEGPSGVAEPPSRRPVERLAAELEGKEPFAEDIAAIRSDLAETGQLSEGSKLRVMKLMDDAEAAGIKLPDELIAGLEAEVQPQVQTLEEQIAAIRMLQGGDLDDAVSDAGRLEAPMRDPAPVGKEEGVEALRKGFEQQKSYWESNKTFGGYAKQVTRSIGNFFGKYFTDKGYRQKLAHRLRNVGYGKKFLSLGADERMVKAETDIMRTRIMDAEKRVRVARSRMFRPILDAPELSKEQRQTEIDEVLQLAALRDLEANAFEEIKDPETGEVIETRQVQLPFDVPLESIQEFRRELEGRLNDRQREALVNIRAHLDEAWESMVERGLIDPEKKRPDYFPHHILDWDDGNLFLPGNRPPPKTPFRGELLKRKGSARLFDTSVRALQDYLLKVEVNNAKHDYMHTVGRLMQDRILADRGLSRDMIEQMDTDEWQAVRRELEDDGIYVLDIRFGRVGQRSLERDPIVQKLMADIATITGSPIIPEVVVGRNIKPGEGRYLATREYLEFLREAQTPDKWARMPGVRAMNRMIGRWIKGPMLRGFLGTAGPSRSARNMVSDLHGIYVKGDRGLRDVFGTLRNLRSARRIIHAFRTKDENPGVVETLSDYELSILQEMENRGILQVNVRGQEFLRDDPTEREWLNKVMPETGGPLGRILSQLYRADFKWARALDDYSENIFRVGYFMRERMARFESLSKENLSSEDAARLAADDAHLKTGDVMVNYNHLTPLERHALNGVVFPFYTWAKGNFFGTAAALAERPLTTIQRAAFASMPFMAWNALFAKEEEERLWHRKPQIAYKPHLILPFARDEFGNPMVLMWESTTGEALRFLGLEQLADDTMQMLIGHQEGQILAKDIVPGVFENMGRSWSSFVAPWIRGAASQVFSSEFVTPGERMEQLVERDIPQISRPWADAQSLFEFGRRERSTGERWAKLAPFIGYVDITEGVPGAQLPFHYEAGRVQRREARISLDIKANLKRFVSGVKAGDAEQMIGAVDRVWDKYDEELQLIGIHKQDLVARFLRSARKELEEEAIIREGGPFSPKWLQLSRTQKVEVLLRMMQQER